MKKRLTTESINKGLILGNVKLTGWSLCIGAGTSWPIFPSWKELVDDLIHSNEPSIRKEAVQEIMSTFSYDALIQAAYTISNNKENFELYLQEKLFSKLKYRISPKEFESVKFMFTQITANRFPDTILKEFIRVRERIFSQTSAYLLAKIVKDASDNEIQPKSILSFNAESLLYSLILSFEREPYIGKPKQHKDVREILDLVTSATSHHLSGRTPYIFCHGALLKGLRSCDYYNASQGTSNLVFSESSYLKLANTVFSWQASNFLYFCSSSVVIFVGISFTDPNVRKWLSWIQSERKEDSGHEGTSHYWITIKPKYEETMDWIESSVWHLGVRVIWVNRWEELDFVLRTILALPLNSP